MAQQAGRHGATPYMPTRGWRAIWLLTLALAAGLCTGAQAADLPAKKDAPEPAPAAADPWNGFYLGGHLGYAGGRSNWSGPDIWGWISRL